MNMKEFFPITAGFFLMISTLIVVLGGVAYAVGVPTERLDAVVQVAGLVMAVTVLYGLFNKRVFRNAVTWLGVW